MTLKVSTHVEVSVVVVGPAVVKVSKSRRSAQTSGIRYARGCIKKYSLKKVSFHDIHESIYTAN